MRRVSLARQLLVLQLVVVAVTLGVVGVVVVRAAQDSVSGQQRDRALSVAHALAESGQVRAALRRESPATDLQPLAEAVRRRSRLSFVVFMSPEGVRFSHPDPRRIGGRFVGTFAPARAGRDVTETTTGTLGPSVRAVVPIRDRGRITGLVAVGVLEAAITGQVRHQLPALVLALAFALTIGGMLSLLLARRVRRQTRGLDPQELATLYEHHDAVLHAIREGVVVVDSDGVLLLANDEARRLLALDDAAIGRPIADLVDSASLAATLAGCGDRGGDLHVVGERVLVSGARAARVGGRRVGTVTTLRDRTELEGLARELGTVRGLADALRAQAHESANELHTVVGLVELGRYDDAVAFATRRIRVTQDEVDLVQQRIGDLTLAALLLAKAAVCRERGVELALDETSDLPADALPGEDLVTMVGNLIDNALDALGAQHGGRIRVRAAIESGAAILEVRDNGPGIPPDALDQVFEAGWSTKPSTDTAERGLGLALVATTAARLGGTAVAANDGGAVVTVRVPVAAREELAASRPATASPWRAAP